MKRINKNIIWLFFILISASVLAQPILVSSTSSSGNVSSLTIPFTVSASSNRILIVNVTSKDKNITSVKYNGTSLTQIAMLSQNSMRSGMYYLIAPATGTANVVIAIASTANASATVSEYSNVMQSSPFSSTSSAKGKNDHPSITIASNTDEIVLASISTIQENPNPDVSMTQISETSSSGSYVNMSKKAGDASVTMSYTFASGNEDDWVMIAGSMKSATISLPVELISFSASIENEGIVNLLWSTASEINNDYFEIEKSNDGVNFYVIGSVRGNGTCNNYNTYTSADIEKTTGVYYYRLVQYDFDGTMSLHKTISVETSSITQEKLHINTFSNSVYTANLINNKIYYLLIHNSNGQLLKEIRVQDNSTIELNDLSAGLYVLTLLRNNAETVVKESTVVH